MLHAIKRLSKSLLKQVKNKSAAALNVAVKQAEHPSTDEVTRYLDGEERRHYLRNQHDVYSVTTILDEMQDGEPDAIKYWKQHNDGQGDNADWQHLLEYKKHRGTLAHHAAMADHYEALNPGQELWSDDESSSLATIMDLDGDPSFLYSITHDKGWVDTWESFENADLADEVSLSDVLQQDLDYFTTQYDRITEERGINEDTLEAIEQMFVVPPGEDHGGYGGQADLIYRDPVTGEGVVADLKTSSGVREKHKYQVAAYANAVEETEEVDIDNVTRGEIIRIHPDSEETEVYTVDDWQSYWREFAETTYETD